MAVVVRLERPTFQLTRPLRGATIGGRNTEESVRISTHTPLAGRDELVRVVCHHFLIFQLTRPLRGATSERARFVRTLPISTHTPLAGRDETLPFYIAAVTNFNSHAPCGARHGKGFYVYTDEQFQLTRPLRGATDFWRGGILMYSISTHTPLAGRDVNFWCKHL